jgi:hypothetical protein
VGVGYAVVAEVAPVAATDRGPLLGAHRRLWRALTGAGALSLAAVLALGVPAERARSARLHGAPRAARVAPGAGRCTRRGGSRARPRTSRRDAVRMSDADVDVGAPVTTADRAVVPGAGRGHWKATPFCTGLAAFRVGSVVAYEAWLARLPRGTAARAGRSIGIARGLAVFCARSQQGQTREQDRKSRHAVVGISEARAEQVPSSLG